MQDDGDDDGDGGDGDDGDDDHEVKTRRVRSAPPTIMTTHPHDQEELHTCQSDSNCSRNPTKP